MKAIFDDESALDVTRAMSITGGWIAGWTGLLLLMVLI